MKLVIVLLSLAAAINSQLTDILNLGSQNAEDVAESSVATNVSQPLNTPEGMTPQTIQVIEADPHAHPYGKPINLMKFEGENIIIDNDSLDQMFQHPEVKNRKIVAVSIVGAFRKGKSFLMDYILRFMYANYKSVAYPNNPLDNQANWIGDPEAPLKGFSWRGGSDRDTTGVVIWSDVFLNEDQAIVLMDTQGLFDTKTSPTENSRIFALGTLISSIQIFNLNDVIQENQLEYLQLATEFAKMAQNSKKAKRTQSFKPFQTLLFLMRDWHNPQDHDFGSDGGAQYLAKTLTIKPDQPPALQEVRKFIEESFETRNCFLLPHPGLGVVGNKNYDGRFSLLDKIFQDQMKELINWLLAPKKLKTKKMLDSEVNGGEYLEYLKMYFEVFKSDEIPEVKTLHAITVSKQFDLIVEAGFDEYKKNIQKVPFEVDGQRKTADVLEQEMKQMHENALRAAIKVFDEKKKMGSKADEDANKAKMVQQIHRYSEEWMKNEKYSFNNIVDLENIHGQKLNETQAEAEKRIQDQKDAAEKEKQVLIDKHNNETKTLSQTLEAVKNKTSQDIKNAMEQTRIELAKQREELQQTLENERKKLEEEKRLKEQEFQNELNKVKEEITRKEEEARILREEQENETLKQMELDAKTKLKEFELLMKQEETRAQAQRDKMEFERKMRLEEAQIRAQNEEKARQDRQAAAAARAQKDQEFMAQMMQVQQANAQAREAAQAQHNAMMHQLLNKEPEKKK